MTNLKRSFFWAIFYLAVVFVLGQADYSGRPIINFASYFYLAAMMAIPITLFFPGISRAPSIIPLVVWGGVYLVILTLIDRSLSTDRLVYSVIVLEFILLETGVWFTHDLAKQIGHAESIMEALALSAFPNSAQDIDLENKRIKMELARSRRYHRPLSLVIIETEADKQKVAREMLRSVQYDLMSRFTSARIGQIIDDRIRQTDLALKDRKGGFIVLCPETDLASAIMLGERISQAVEERTDLHILWGAAAFPEEALTFDDLLLKARERLARSISAVEKQEIETVKSYGDVRL